MAADKRTAFLAAYREMVGFFPFLSTFFQTTPRDIVNAESVEIDIQRGTRKVAPVISALSQRAGKIVRDPYTEKEFKPPIVALGADFAPGDLIEKAFGRTEYGSADQSYEMQLMAKMVEYAAEMNGQVMRNVESQAAQILQTGTVTLYDADGNAAYTIDFSPKATHFPTVSTAWSNVSTATPDLDLQALFEVIKQDAKVNPANIVFGADALYYYLNNANVKTKFDLRRVESGVFNPQEVNPDARYLGDILVGPYRLAAWHYDGYYENQAGNTVPFVDDDKVIMLPQPGAMNVDLRRVWCRVPTIGGIDPRFQGMVPAELNTGDQRYTTRVYLEDTSDTLNMELKARPLNIPVSIDSFGALDVTP